MKITELESMPFNRPDLSRFDVKMVNEVGENRDLFYVEEAIPNMSYIAPKGMFFDGYSHLLPQDVQLRRRLSDRGLSGLPTVVVLPGVKLNVSVLNIAQSFVMEKVNELNLPSMDQLYIRTRNHRFTSIGGRVNPIFSSRSLIVNGKYVEHVDESSITGKSIVEYSSPSDWQKTLPINTIFMIHAEDDLLQRRCLHGIVGMTGVNQISLAIGDGRVHARALDSRLTMQGSKLKPFLRLKGAEFDRLRLDGGGDEKSAYSTLLDAERLRHRWEMVKGQVIQMHEEVMMLCGNGAMMEWRAYPDGQVHVLDVDSGF